jgi:hypothetical protein
MRKILIGVPFLPITPVARRIIQLDREYSPLDQTHPSLNPLHEVAVNVEHNIMEYAQIAHTKRTIDEMAR